MAGEGVPFKPLKSKDFCYCENVSEQVFSERNKNHVFCE